MDKIDGVLSLLGLAKKAGRLEAGEEPVGTAARLKAARLILLASDAAGNSARRAEHFAEAGACLCARIPATKDALGSAVGRASCAMLALTDIGFASAVAAKLAAIDEAGYGELAQRLSIKAARAAERRDPQRRRQREKKKEAPAPGKTARASKEAPAHDKAARGRKEAPAPGKAARERKEAPARGAEERKQQRRTPRRPRRG